MYVTSLALQAPVRHSVGGLILFHSFLPKPLSE